ncbi:MAG: hypothetical protein MUO90_03910 [Dehalococcoidales bacterium]|nr:hypothetical protein [Dehalococcoidales bacterium]
MIKEAQRVGEVIEASTTGFIAQCYQLYRLPPLGSLVKTKNEELELYAVVCNATTTSLDTGRKPIARGKDEDSEEAIYKSSPQLEKLLKSEFNALVVGHRANDRINHYLPPVPARIHSFAYLCPDEEVKEFSQSLGFLSILLNTSPSLPQDELVAACLRYMGNVQDDSRSFLVAAGKYLTSLLGGDYNQLKSILERIKQ